MISHMSTPAARYFGRFLVTAVAGTTLTLWMVSVCRIVYVHRRFTQAVSYFAVGRPDRVARELCLAYVWSPAYTTLCSPIQYLYRDAVSKNAQPSPLPPLVPRSFGASLPVMEKALIPFDVLTDAIYRLLVPVRPLPLPSAVEAVAVVPVRPTDDPPRLDEQAAATPRPRIRQDRPPRAVATGEHHSPPSAPISFADSEWMTARPSAAAPVPDGAPAGVDHRRAGHAGARAAAPPVPPGGPTVLPATVNEGMWGAITAHNAPLYNQSGARIRVVPAGSLVDVQRLQTVSSGEIIIGTVWSRAGTFQDVMLRRGDVELYLDGALTSTTREQRELVSRRAELLAAIEIRAGEMAEAAADRNPHQKDYRQVLTEYKAFSDETDRLMAEFDSSTGSRRMEIANRLRVLKNEQTMLMPRYQEIKQKKERWDERNRNRRPASDPGNDPETLRLKQELMDVDEQLYDL